MAKSGIYIIQSKIKPERIYIGSAVDFKNRWWKHKRSLKLNNHRNSILQRHYNKYGEEDLIFIVLLECDRNNLISVEQEFINSLNPFFNINKVANSNFGRKWSEKTKRKMSDSQKGKPRGKTWNKGKQHSKETRSKLKLAWQKRRLNPVSEATKRKISLSLIGNNRSVGKSKRDKEGRFIKKEHITI